jgi:UDP-N-acetylmuramyl pentapeptide phosphotransferase/UDP-N-acetylglucosamine-1-phosphate transferase
MIAFAASLVAGFLVTFFSTPYAEKYLMASGIFAVDQQKKDKPRLASSGGITVLFGFLSSITVYMALTSIPGNSTVNLTILLAALSSVIIISLIGLLDDIHVDLEAVMTEHLSVGDEKIDIELHRQTNIESLPHQRLLDRLSGNFSQDKDSKEDEMLRNGLGQIPKMLFVLPAALPLIAVGAGSWSMTVPIIGYTINWGVFYPLILLPLGLLFVSNVVNMLAGTNGLSGGMSLVASIALGVFGYLNGQIEAAVIAWSLSAALAAFMYFNFHPASILPGDSLTYLCGAALFSSMVIGNMEKFGVFIFAPWITEFFLKLRSGFSARSWGILQEDGTLKSHHDKIYSLTHVFMRQDMTERQITVSLITIESIICVTGLFLFTVVL